MGVKFKPCWEIMLEGCGKRSSMQLECSSQIESKYYIALASLQKFVKNLLAGFKSSMYTLFMTINELHQTKIKQNIKC